MKRAIFFDKSKIALKTTIIPVKVAALILLSGLNDKSNEDKDGKQQKAWLSTLPT